MAEDSATRKGIEKVGVSAPHAQLVEARASLLPLALRAPLLPALHAVGLPALFAVSGAPRGARRGPCHLHVFLGGVLEHQNIILISFYLINFQDLSGRHVADVVGSRNDWLLTGEWELAQGVCITPGIVMAPTGSRFMLFGWFWIDKSPCLKFKSSLIFIHSHYREGFCDDSTS